MAFLFATRTDTDTTSTQAGLLLLRVGAGLSLWLKHGLEKLTGYGTMVQHFPDPIHIGAHASLAYALLTDGLCSVLVILGLFTRPASALIVLNLLTAFVFVHHAAYFRDGHVEMIAVYLVAFAALALTGPGTYSLDARRTRRTRG
ncbi:MAG: DoxX family protein [Acidobacteriota bacterium]|nr:DoxX family protein [Acidobacteriota bacterium]